MDEGERCPSRRAQAGILKMSARHTQFARIFIDTEILAIMKLHELTEALCRAGRRAAQARSRLVEIGGAPEMQQEKSDMGSGDRGGTRLLFTRFAGQSFERDTQFCQARGNPFRRRNYGSVEEWPQVKSDRAVADHAPNEILSHREGETLTAGHQTKLAVHRARKPQHERSGQLKGGLVLGVELRSTTRDQKGVKSAAANCTAGRPCSMHEGGLHSRGDQSGAVGTDANE